MATDRLLYGLNLTLLATHQVDAAFWHEWDVFGVPGGSSFFLAFNFVAVALLVFGLVRVAENHPTGRTFAFVCAGIGWMTVLLHAAVFAFRDRVAFWTPLSIGILVAIAATSALQLLVTLRSSGGARRGAVRVITDEL